MSLENFPLIDTTDLDALVSSYAVVHENSSPIDLFSQTENGMDVEDELVNLIRSVALKDLAGVAIFASARFAVGRKAPDALTDVTLYTDGSCSFAGRLADVRACDFTSAMQKASLIGDSEEKVWLPGLIFKTDNELSESVPTLGVASLAPYCALLPGSPYELRRVIFNY